MFKPYDRNQRKTDYIIGKCDERYRNFLYTVLKDKDTLYEIQDIPNNIQLFKYTMLKSITGVDNVVIVIDELNENIYFIDEKHGYSVECICGYVGLYQHLVGLYNYVLASSDIGYIIKTNYKSVDELKMKFDIDLNNYNDFMEGLEIILDTIR